MFNASFHGVELAGINDNGLVSQFNGQLPLQDHEAFILMIMFMKNKFPLYLGKDDLLSIEFLDSPW